MLTLVERINITLSILGESRIIFQVIGRGKNSRSRVQLGNVGLDAPLLETRNAIEIAGGTHSVHHRSTAASDRAKSLPRPAERRR